MCIHGFYIIYRTFDDELGRSRWFVEYESGADRSENRNPTGNAEGYESFEIAQVYCEKDAQELECMLTFLRRTEDFYAQALIAAVARTDHAVMLIGP